MAEATEAERGADEQEKDPRFAAAKREGQGDRGREMVAHASMGAELDDEEETSALGWLLGAPQPIIHEVTVQYETDTGYAPLTFVLKQIAGRKIDTIEQRHVSQITGRIDGLAANCEIVAEATVKLFDPSRPDGVVLKSDEFLSVQRQSARDGRTVFKHASPAEALEERFATQLGLIGNVARKIREIAGYDAERVGDAQRRLVTASLD